MATFQLKRTLFRGVLYILSGFSIEKTSGKKLAIYSANSIRKWEITDYVIFMKRYPILSRLPHYTIYLHNLAALILHSALLGEAPDLNLCLAPVVEPSADLVCMAAVYAAMATHAAG